MLLLAISLIAPSRGSTWVVDQTGGGDALTIEDGVDLLEDGDRLEIRAGTYYEGSISVQVENVQIEGDGPELTIMDGAGAEYFGFKRIGGGVELSEIGFMGYQTSAVRVTNSEESAAAIDIHDVWATDSYRGVMLVESEGVRVTVSSSFFGDITNSAFLVYTEGDLWVEGCLIVEAGEGIQFGSGYSDSLQEGSQLNVIGNTFVNALMVSAYTALGEASLFATNNIIAGSLGGPWVVDTDISGEISNNLVGSDVTGPGINLSSAMDDSANLSGDPMFVDRTDDGDATNDDLRLLLGSAAIDVGVEGYATLTTDLDGTTRPVDGDDDGTALPDVGAYEFVRVDEDGDGELADTVGGEDCDDTDPTILPGAEEICGDGVDQDCDELDPTCPEDTGLPDSGTSPDTGSPADSAAPGDTAAPTDTGPPEDTAALQETGHPPGQGDSGDSFDGAQLANHGPAPRCGGNGQGALLLWPAMWLVARRRRAQALP